MCLRELASTTGHSQQDHDVPQEFCAATFMIFTNWARLGFPL